MNFHAKIGMCLFKVCSNGAGTCTILEIIAKENFEIVDVPL